MQYLLLPLLLCFPLTHALNNGLALTPPMGWLTWERFRCHTDCKTDPLNCISEHLIKGMADQMVLKGFRDVGYDTVIVDDCWLSRERDADGKLQPDPVRFPSGIKALADYVHNLGLKFGIYESFGNLTCEGYPGSLGHLEVDANTFAEWGADYVKIDGCKTDIHIMPKGYRELGGYLNATGRPMVYSCSWPAYFTFANVTPDYAAIAETCNLWRNYNDMEDAWRSILGTIDFYGDRQDEFAQFAAPGQWNDPDVLIIGNFGLSYDQAKVQMAVWSLLAAPLIMSNDLRTIRPEFISILQNRNVLKINKDPLGYQGRRVHHDKSSGINIFVKHVMPSFQGSYSAAVAIVYRAENGTQARVTFTPKQIGLDHSGGYTISEVFEGAFLGSYFPHESITVMVNPVGVQLLRFDVNPSNFFASYLNDGDTCGEIEVQAMGLTGRLI